MFSLFDGKPSLTELEKAFGAALKERVRETLELLVAQGLVETDVGTCNYRLKNSHLIFNTSGSSGISPMVFLQEAINHASNSVTKWYSSPEKAVFSSTLVSVSEKDLQTTMKKIRQALLELQVSSESPSPDALVRFNVQVYPHELEG